MTSVALPPPPPSAMAWPSPIPSLLSHMLLAHKALRRTAADLHAAARALSPTAPDADLTALRRASESLNAAVCAHCAAEDRALIPALSNRLAAMDATGAGGQERPLKRSRTSMPVEDTVHCDTNTGGMEAQAALVFLRELAVDHGALPMSFSALQKSLAACLAARAATRASLVATIAEKAASVEGAIGSHLDAEERRVLPTCDRLLGEKEQQRILVRVAVETFGDHPVGGDRKGAVAHGLFRVLDMEDTVAFFRPLQAYAAGEELAAVATAVAAALPRERWERLCHLFPRLKTLAPCLDNPLIEITYLHKAIRRELCDLVTYCLDVDVEDDLQLQTVAKRLAFLRQVHSYHSEGEDTVLLKELKLRLANNAADSTTTTPSIPAPAASAAVVAVAVASSPVETTSRLGNRPSSVFHEEHSDEVRLFDVISAHVTLLRAQLTSSSPVPAPTPEIRKESLVASVRDIADHLINHMEQEEKDLLPLLRQHFTVADQDVMMRRVMAQVPPSFLPELIPWVIFTLSIDDQESLLRNVLRTASKEVFRRTASLPLAKAVAEGMYDAAEWNELCVRIPELRPQRESAKEMGDAAEDEGPVSEVLRVHKAIRVELHALLRAATALPDELLPNARAVDVMAERVAFLGRMVGEHSKAEDIVLLPRLEERSPGVAKRYQSEHCEERLLFTNLSSLLRQLQCCMDDDVCSQLVRKVRVVTRTLRDEMVEHLKMEEKDLWPILTSNFTKDEQVEIVACIFGLMPSERLQELLPWMLRVLSVSEQTTMMTHILQVTKSTMFEAWLNSWFPHIPGTTVARGENLAARPGATAAVVGSPGCGARENARAPQPGEPTTAIPSRVDVAAKPENQARGSEGVRLAPPPSPRRVDGSRVDGTRPPCSSTRDDISGRGKRVERFSGTGDVGDETASAAAALVLLRGRDNMVRAIKEIAKDTSLSMEVRTRMMQQVMLAPWCQKEGRTVASTGGDGASSTLISPAGTCSHSMQPSNGTSLEDAGDNIAQQTSVLSPRSQSCPPPITSVRGENCAVFSKEELAPSFRDKERRVLGCSHYARSCKLLAACCSKLYPCRLCHDEAESHVMDRTATEKMLCMVCSVLQPVAERCASESCGEVMARYFCGVCRFFDDDVTRDKYHCAFCNVCRVGKGPGQDRQHCMRCNTCMSLNMAHNHVCVERAMESDCPVCHQYLFSSTTPVSYLRCGHLMHTSCKSMYTKKGNISCPVCSKSLEELAPVFKKLDHLLAGDSMPREYRTARCDLLCLDCSLASNVPYHFLYNKCPHCGSYNTRIDRVDANAGSPRMPAERT